MVRLSAAVVMPTRNDAAGDTRNGATADSSIATTVVIEQAKAHIGVARTHILRANATVRRVQGLLEHCQNDQLAGLAGCWPPTH
jgi:hypothetical protein